MNFFIVIEGGGGNADSVFINTKWYRYIIYIYTTYLEIRDKTKRAYNILYYLNRVYVAWRMYILYVPTFYGLYEFIATKCNTNNTTRYVNI